MKLESSKIRILFVQAVTLVLFVFQLYTAGLGSLPGTQQLSLHFGLVMIILFLTIGWHGKRKANDPLRVWDFIFIALVIFCAGIAFLAWRRWMMFPSRMSTTDLIGAAIITVLILEGSRRLLGWALHIVLAVLLVYVLVGQYLPGRFGTASFGWIPTLRALGVDGAWGWITSISARTIAVYMLFGGMLAAFGGAKPFIEVANVIAGRFRGGPALVAVVGSGLFGTVSGSAMANVATVGSVTIPLMKKMGYRPEFAGGIESAASTGGQIMPPVMGAGAFVMAEMLGVRYLDVAIAAFLPAVMFYAGVFMGVLLEARKANLRPVPREQIPAWRSVVTWEKLAPFIIPMATLVYFLMTGWSVNFAGFTGCIAILVIYLFIDLKPARMWQRIVALPKGLIESTQAIITLAPLFFICALIVELITFTGAGVKLSEVIIYLGGNVPVFALMLTAVVAIVLGMGMPTTPAYLITAAVGGPALIKLGFPPLAVHLFIFYFAIFSGITPPVCTVAFTGAAMCGASWLKVAWVACRLSIVSFVLPFLFFYHPGLLMVGSVPSILITTVQMFVAALCVSAAIWGWFFNRLNLMERALLTIGAVMIGWPSTTASLVAMAPIAVVVFTSYMRSRRAAGTSVKTSGADAST